MIQKHNTALLVIDVQEKLFPVMHDKQTLLEKVRRIIQGVQILDMPVILTEQYPKGLGTTVDELIQVLDTYSPIEKKVFGCCADAGFVEVLEQTKGDNILVSGIEAHVCVYQTVVQLLERGYHVEVVADAVDSRFPLDKRTALQKVRDLGGLLTTVEMVLFELQQIAQGEQFKALSRLIK